MGILMERMDDDALIAWAIGAFASRGEAYATFRDYYDGRHPLAFATEKFKSTFGRTFNAYAYNRCDGVVDAIADRLQVQGFEEANGGASGKRAEGIWQRNRMDQRAGQVHVEALRCGDAYLVVWPMSVDRDDPSSPVRVTMYPEAAQNVRVRYDREVPGRITLAAKMWQEDTGTWRLTLYTTDAIARYVTMVKADAPPEKPAGFVPFVVDGEAWPTPNEYETIPVFHFANNAAMGGYGRSELRGIIPLQDALNKDVMDRLVAQEYTAFRQRWATGVEPIVDPLTGKEVSPFTPGVDKLWAAASDTARFGDFDATDIKQFLSAEEADERKISRASRVPMHWLDPGGTPPSGESLKTLEAPFVAKIKDRHVAFGNVWEDAMTLALRMDGLDADVSLSTRWESPEPRGERDTWEVGLMKLQCGVSPQQVQREGDYADDQIAAMLVETGQAMEARGETTSPFSGG